MLSIDEYLALRPTKTTKIPIECKCCNMVIRTTDLTHYSRKPKKDKHKQLRCKCSKGVPHRMINEIENKMCQKCHIWKPLDQFYNNRCKWDNKYPSCAKCCKEHEKNRRDSDPTYNLVKMTRNRINVALKTVKKTVTTIELLGCTATFCREYISSQFSEGMHWNNHGKGQGAWNIDHRRPIASFDLTKTEEQRKCFHYSNLQPMWESENRRKSDKYDPETFTHNWNGDMWVLKSSTKPKPVMS